MHEKTTTPDRAARLRRLQASFLADAVEEVAELGRILAGSAPQATPDSLDDRARTIAHDLRGAGGSYGFDAVSEAAGLVEDAILDGACVARLEALAHGLSAAVEQAHAAAERAPDALHAQGTA